MKKMLVKNHRMSFDNTKAGSGDLERPNELLAISPTT